MINEELNKFSRVVGNKVSIRLNELNELDEAGDDDVLIEDFTMGFLCRAAETILEDFEIPEILDEETFIELANSIGMWTATAMVRAFRLGFKKGENLDYHTDCAEC